MEIAFSEYKQKSNIILKKCEDIIEKMRHMKYKNIKLLYGNVLSHIFSELHAVKPEKKEFRKEFCDKCHELYVENTNILAYTVEHCRSIDKFIGVFENYETLNRNVHDKLFHIKKLHDFKNEIIQLSKDNNAEKCIFIETIYKKIVEYFINTRDQFCSKYECGLNHKNKSLCAPCATTHKYIYETYQYDENTDMYESVKKSVYYEKCTKKHHFHICVKYCDNYCKHTYMKNHNQDSDEDSWENKKLIHNHKCTRSRLPDIYPEYISANFIRRIEKPILQNDRDSDPLIFLRNIWKSLNIIISFLNRLQNAQRQISHNIREEHIAELNKILDVYLSQHLT